MSSFGEELKRERELRQITLREISESTKINLRYLEALERNDFTHLPGGVFNKGFVRAFAEHIGVDAEAMVNAYLLEEKSQREERNEALSPAVFRPAQDTSPTEPPGKNKADEDKPDWDGWRRLARIALTGVAIGLLGVLLALLAIQLGTGAGQEEPASVAAPEKESLREHPPSKKPGQEESTDPAAPADTPATETASSGIPLGGSSPERKPPPVKPEPVKRPPPNRVRTEPAPSREPPPMRVALRRATQGRLNCDNRRIEILDGMAPGTEIVFHCRDRLLIDVRDGGALLLERGNSDPVPVGDDGVPVRGLRVTPWPKPEPPRTGRE